MILGGVKVKVWGTFVDFATYAAHTFFITPIFAAGQNHMAHLGYVSPFMATGEARIQAIRSSLRTYIFTSTFSTSAHNNPLHRTAATPVF